MPSERLRIFRTRTEEETIAAGEQIAQMLRPPALVVLTGELGAGKTTLVKGIAKGCGVAEPDEVSSPSFTLIQEYGDPPQVYHVDLYRIQDAADLETIGLEELFDRPALIVIEWGERFLDQLPLPRWEITVRRLPDESREIQVAYTSTEAI